MGIVAYCGRGCKGVKGSSRFALIAGVMKVFGGSFGFFRVFDEVDDIDDDESEDEENDNDEEDRDNEDNLAIGVRFVEEFDGVLDVEEAEEGGVVPVVADVAFGVGDDDVFGFVGVG